MGHTKGDWKSYQTDIKPDRWTICAGKDGERGIASTVLDNSISPAEKEANAQLISQAPRLLEACKRGLKEIRELEGQSRSISKFVETPTKKQLKEAIAKAEVKEVKMPEPKWGHKGEPCSYNEDINCQEDACLYCATFEKYIISIP